MKPEMPASAGRLPLFRQELRRSLSGFGGWILGNAAALLVYLPFFPSIRSSTDTVDYAALFPPELSRVFGLDQLATGAGYTQATYFGLIALLLYAIAAVGWGAGAIAGDEESGALELTLAHAVTRTQVVLERALAIL
ncbi:MAG TPA: ABC transporter permease subunit, partial [Trueperaceae bacterium]|nr:ABC transporter permease subunit [Trueperaceae bacterium]